MMEQPTVKIALVHPDAKMPTRGSEDAAGFDLYARIERKRFVEPGETVKVPTGLCMEIPRGWMGLILPRSGWAVEGVDTRHPPIDADYRGEVHILLSNSGWDKVIHPGERCAQIVFVPHLAFVRKVELAELSETRRGTGGFGSTGGAPQ